VGGGGGLGGGGGARGGGVASYAEGVKSSSLGGGLISRAECCSERRRNSESADDHAGPSPWPELASINAQRRQLSDDSCSDFLIGFSTELVFISSILPSSGGGRDPL
jgi:hypothetical protein